MKHVLIFLLTFSAAFAQDKEKVANTLDTWHKAAADAKFDAYFGLMSADAVFIGTDPSEHWDKEAFMKFSRPFFDKGKAWNFKPVERHIYFSKDGNLAWFDELLDTWMKICRGSGVLRKEKGEWKLVQYVLSMTVPNENTDAVIKLITPFEDDYLKKLRK